MLYQQFFNFNTAPFSIAPDPQFIYMSEHHMEGLAHLLYGINYGGGFVVLTGEVGTGKTTLCHCLLQQLPEKVEIALVLNPKVNAIELLATICDELQIIFNNKKQSLKYLVDHLNEYLLKAHANGEKVVLVIDEAQNLSLKVLEQIRLLTNLETSTSKLLQVILLGQPELKKLLENKALRQLNQRITARFHLTELCYEDTQQYIQHRLKVSGGDPHVFNPRAIKKIYTLTHGTPRLINILCDRALLGAYVNGTHRVTGSIIKKAAEEAFGQKKPGINKSVTSILVMLVTLGLGLYLLPKFFKVRGQDIVAVDAKNGDKSISPKILSRDKLPTFLQALIESKNATLAVNIQQLASEWGKQLKPSNDCQLIEKTGLACLFDKADWQTLKSLNRPVIMEFLGAGEQKGYALLLGVINGLPVFKMAEGQNYPLKEVLAQWNGYYLMLWQPPIPSVTTVSPGMTSDVVLWVRQRLGLLPTGKKARFFDVNLKLAVINFQKQKGLLPDGIVGARTFIHLENDNPLDGSPKLRWNK